MRTNKKIKSGLRRFEGRCLRRILRIRWQDHVTNEDVRWRTGININNEVKRRKWSWLGHAALRWAPPGKRKRGRLMGTWRRTVEEEMKGKTWNELGWMAQDRNAWRRHVDALCSARSPED